MQLAATCGAANGGVVHVIYGSGSGLTAPGSQVWGHNSGGIIDSAETGDGLRCIARLLDVNIAFVAPRAIAA